MTLRLMQVALILAVGACSASPSSPSFANNTSTYSPSSAGSKRSVGGEERDVVIAHMDHVGELGAPPEDFPRVERGERQRVRRLARRVRGELHHAPAGAVPLGQRMRPANQRLRSGAEADEERPRAGEAHACLALGYGEGISPSRLVVIEGHVEQLDEEGTELRVDGRPVSLIWLLASPPDKTGPHIHALARISRLMTMDKFRAALSSAKTVGHARGLLVRDVGAAAAALFGVPEYSAEDALGQLESFMPDIVLTDNSLPGMSGHDLIQKLRISAPDLKLLHVTDDPDERVDLRTRRGAVASELGTARFSAAPHDVSSRDREGRSGRRRPLRRRPRGPAGFRPSRPASP